MAHEEGSDGVSAAHQSLRREVNEQIRRLHDEFHATGELDVFCECGRRSCASRFVMSVGDYEFVRRQPLQYLVLEGHDVLRSERVVSERRGFVVVEKSAGGLLRSVRADLPEQRFGG
ncbi:MAG TPA: hypothetical protein VNI55_12635 [Gaiellaceae bacterium]|nr:hypothetical protein [Gaiellaceae bacterium]